FEVLTAVSAEIGSEKVGVRLSLLNSYNSMIDSDPIGLASFLGERLTEFKLAYVHMMRSDFFGVQKGDVLTPMRAAYQGVIISNMGYSAEEAEQAIADGQVDAVAFGTGFLANPDLPERIRKGAAWNPPNPATFYTPGAAGYTDYPVL
ncbi:MAG: alkene reductase, partial [Thiothrix sp.]